MSITSQQAKVSYCEEIIEGQIPSNPQFNQISITAIQIEEYSITKGGTYLSERVPYGSRVLGTYVEGYISSELRLSDIQLFLKDLLRDNGSKHDDFNFNTSTLSASASTQTFVDSNINLANQGLKVGQFIQISGFTELQNNGIFRVYEMPNDQTLKVHGENIIVDEVAGDTITIDCESYKDGIEVGKTYTFREDIDILKEYYVGCKITSIVFNFRVGEIISVIINIKGLSRTTSVPSGESFVLYEPISRIINAANDIRLAYIGSSFDVIRHATSIDLEINNQSYFVRSAGELSPRTIHDSDLLINLNTTVYLEDHQVYDVWDIGGFITFGILVNDDSNNFCISINRLQLSNVARGVPGKNTFIFETYNSFGVKDDEDKGISINFY